MEKVCVIAVYFGKFPNYFPLWLKSCGTNPTVEFLLVTDADVKNHPDNVIVYKTNLFAVRERASKVLGFEAALDRPYKLCDYKPVYGLMFSDLLKEYDYWGHCDVDLLFGDLRGYFKKYKLSEYERFLPLGHLSLYRNNEDTNNRFKDDRIIPNYKEVFTSDKHYVFDELGGMTPFYASNDYPFFKNRVFADIASVYNRYRVIEEYVYDEKPRNYPYQIFTWESSRCFREWIEKGRLNREEYAYIHFKKRPDFELTFDVNDVNSFYITNTGFYEKKSETTLETIKKLNPYPGKKHEVGEFLKAHKGSFIDVIKRRIKR